MPNSRGWTLTELLITLLILGEIATFTIPKVLIAQQNTAWNAAAKEAAGAISQAYMLYKQSNTPGTGTSTTDLVPYFNYVKIDSTTTIDHVTGQDKLVCSWTATGCLVLHNGGYLYPGGSYFGETDARHYIHFQFDPDGRYSGTTNGTGKAISILLFYNGRVVTAAERQATGDKTWIGGSEYEWGPDSNASWFQW